MAKSDWVRVRSESELRPGMTVMATPSGRRSMLLRAVPDDPEPGTWETADPRPVGSLYIALHARRAIEDGNLYRLRDLDEADETAEVAKELEVTSG